ncbi:protein obstructor-E isoform X2 [Neocloeon triangulifer]|uniref:protein obstructor-E isoform X2 n=1 Tax=Neocloeon triangulifer TaxID=2078957 RepID=UPI00286F3201|nr:protein obstructor-E isoform X2 [Neocloeon triangulifer]
MAKCLLLVASLVAASLAAEFRCPAKYGQYEDERQCDKYYECEEGVATEKLCPDGLVFDPTNRKYNKCDQPFNVDCGDRTELQPAKSTEKCPRQNGYFAHPDPAICNVFFNCIDGDAIESQCSSGLVFDEYAGVCSWPKKEDKECGSKRTVLKDGFSCPKEDQLDANGRATDHPKYAHPEDCQKFYVCLNGVTPREQGCSLGEAYNEEKQLCDDPENVPGCEDWYKDHPEVANLKNRGAQIDAQFVSNNPKRNKN